MLTAGCDFVQSFRPEMDVTCVGANAQESVASGGM